MKSIELAHGRDHLHLADFGGEGGTFVLVHGLGGSHANFAALGPDLAREGRVLALDLPGFGLSPPGARADLDAHFAALSRLAGAIRTGEIPGASLPFVLLGNSMGGAVAIRFAARRPIDVRALVLVCPALPPANVLELDRRFALLLGSSMLPGYDAFLRRRLGAVGPEAMVHEMLRLTCVDPGRIPARAIEEMEALARRRLAFPWLGSAFSQSARSVVSALLRRGSFHDDMRKVRAPVLLVHGARDRLVPVASARAALGVCPSWRLEVWDDVGHVPQLEAHDRLAAAVSSFVRG